VLSVPSEHAGGPPLVDEAGAELLVEPGPKEDGSALVTGFLIEAFLEPPLLLNDDFAEEEGEADLVVTGFEPVSGAGGSVG
jgi:hypothetical protein